MFTEKHSDSRTRFARRVFMIAAIYGVVVLIPQYFLEARLGRDFPPPITHPEHFYGFIGVALAFQVLFFIIATDPVRYRAAMIPAILEKVTFVVACIILYSQGRLAPMILGPVGLDLILAILFAISYRVTPKQD
ncbi:MAG: hypothetical protein ACRD4B_04945 [Acidobacteriota bacterium]